MPRPDVGRPAPEISFHSHIVPDLVDPVDQVDPG